MIAIPFKIGKDIIYLLRNKEKRTYEKITGRPTCGTKMHKAWWSHRQRRHSNNVYKEKMEERSRDGGRLAGFSGGLWANLAACCAHDCHFKKISTVEGNNRCISLSSSGYLLVHFPNTVKLLSKSLRHAQCVVLTCVWWGVE